MASPSIVYKKIKEAKFFILAGPCVVESEELNRAVAVELKEICEELGIFLIYKSSYRKANRSRTDSFRGIGDEKALEILKGISEDFDLPIVTDIHSEAEAETAARAVDVLQIPAFLCRQTALLEAAADTGAIINIKKGQFLSPEMMKFAAEKVTEAGNEKVLLTERGTTFGYTDLVVDMRSIPIMKGHGFPVIMDCTHSLQRPNQSSGVTGGDPSMISTIASAAVAAGTNGLFIETHPDPSQALSDGANMLSIEKIRPMLRQVMNIREAVIYTSQL